MYSYQSCSTQFLYQGDFLSKLRDLDLSEEEDCVTRLEEISEEQHFEVKSKLSLKTTVQSQFYERLPLWTLRRRVKEDFTNAWCRCRLCRCQFVTVSKRRPDSFPLTGSLVRSGRLPGLRPPGRCSGCSGLSSAPH